MKNLYKTKSGNMNCIRMHPHKILLSEHKLLLKYVACAQALWLHSEGYTHLNRQPKRERHADK